MESQPFFTQSGSTTSTFSSNSGVTGLTSTLSAKFLLRSACALSSGLRDEVTLKYLNSFFPATKTTSKPSAVASCQAPSPSQCTLQLITETQKSSRFCFLMELSYLQRTTGPIRVSTLQFGKIELNSRGGLSSSQPASQRMHQMSISRAPWTTSHPTCLPSSTNNLKLRTSSSSMVWPTRTTPILRA